MLRPAFAAFALFSMASAAPTLAQPVPEAKVTGNPVNCVSLRNIRSTTVRNDSTIDFFMTGGRVFRNTLPNSCPQLGFERAFSYQTSITQLCNVDIITVLVRGGGLGPGASCGLGKFTPVEFPTRK